MIEARANPEAPRALAHAEQLFAAGDVRGAIDALTVANRAARDARLERALVRVRRDGCRLLAPSRGRATPVATTPDGPGDGRVVEVDRASMTVGALRTGLDRSGCLLVRGLVPTGNVEELTAGIDAALEAHDVADAGGEVDPGWYHAFTMPDRVTTADVGDAVDTDHSESLQPNHIPERLRRKFIRSTGGLWTAYSPHMLFELFEVVDEVGIGSLMTEFFGERPFLSANKCTLRRVPPDAGLGGWHQDGAFLGDYVGAFNLWVALTRCGRDAPGMDLVPRRFDHVLKSDDAADFDWSLSDQAVRRAAGDTPIVRPEFEAGDALLFDHLLVHRTAATPDMKRERHAIEAWFFAPSAYPKGQLPLVY